METEGFSCEAGTETLDII